MPPREERDYLDLDPYKKRVDVFSDHGTTTPDGRRLYKNLQKILKPIIFEYCDRYKPHEVMHVAQAIIGLEAMSYAGALRGCFLREERKKQIGGTK